MREITEAQAQELANLSGCMVSYYSHSNSYEISVFSGDAVICVCPLPITVKTEKPNIERVWRPE